MTLDTINMDYTVNNEVHTQQQVIAVWLCCTKI